jgi:hypothetical protein
MSYNTAKEVRVHIKTRRIPCLNRYPVFMKIWNGSGTLRVPVRCAHGRGLQRDVVYLGYQ